MSIKKLTLADGPTRYRADWRDSRGRRHIKVVTTRRDALDLVGHARERRRLGEDSVDAKMTVAELSKRFLASRATAADSTLCGTRSSSRSTSNPELGHVRVADLRRSHIEALRNDLLKAIPASVLATRIARLMQESTLEGEKREAQERAIRKRFEGKPAGVHTVHKVLTTVIAALNFAIDEQIIRSNVAERVKKPSLRTVDSETGEVTEANRVTEADIFTPAEFARVLAHVQPHYRLLD